MSASLFISAQNYWTTVGSTSSGWEAYQVAGVPSGWPNCSGTSNWGAPIAGYGNPNPPGYNEFTAIYDMFPADSKPIIPNHYVWSVDTFPRTTYYRKILNRDSTTCNRVRLIICSDEDREVFVNGNSISQVSFSSGLVVTDIDITEYLICGENCITVEVTNQNSYCLLVANLKVTSQQIEFSGNAGYNENLKCNDTLELYAPVLNEASYTWTGPNNFISTLPNPTITNVKNIHKGWYYVTLRLGCCKLVDSVFVNIENCDTCSATLNLSVAPCDALMMDIDSRFVNLECEIWQVNGVTIFESPILERGNHEVCAHYLGYTFNDPNRICCERICDTIFIEGIIEENDSQTICNLPPFDEYSFDPSIGGYHYYKLYEIPEDLISEGLCNPSFLIPLESGLYRIEYYDEAMCLRKVVNLELELIEPDTSSCNKTIYIPCDSTEFVINPENLFPPGHDGSYSECPCPYDSTDNFVREVLYQGIDSNGNEFIVVRFINYTKCAVCDITYTFIEDRCNFDVEFIMLRYTGQPEVWYLKRHEPDSICGDEVWQFFDQQNVEVFPILIPYFHPTYGWGYSVTLSSGFIGEVCLTACKCICENDSCCKRSCYDISANAPNSSNDDLFNSEEFRHSISHQEYHLREVSFNNRLKLIPNPTNHSFQLVSLNNVVEEYSFVKLYNSLGEEIYNWTEVKSTEIFVLPHGISQGNYYIEVKDNLTQLISKMKLLVY